MAENKPFIKKNFMTEHRKQIVSFASHANSVYFEDKTLEEVLHEIIEAIENLPSDLNTCSKISLECDPQTYELSAVLYNKDNEVIYTSNIVDLPIETLVLDVVYDSEQNALIITYKSGETVTIPISSMVSGLQEKIDLQHPLPAAFISGLARVAITGSYEDLIDRPTINGVEIVGDLSLEDLGITPGGTENYNDLINKPAINGVDLEGDKSLQELGIMPAGGDEFHAEDYYDKDGIAAILRDYLLSDDAACRVGIGYDTKTDKIYVYLEDAKCNAFPLLDGLPISALNKLSRDKVVSGSYDATNKRIILTKENQTTQSFTIADLINGLASEEYVDDAVTGLASVTYVDNAMATLPTSADLERKQDKLTAGANITIQNNVISATGGGGGGIQYNAVDPMLISGTDLIFNRTLDETIATADISATTRIPTNKAVTTYISQFYNGNIDNSIANYMNIHGSEYGRIYTGDDPIVVNNNTNKITFDRIITPTISTTNKSLTSVIPSNKAVTDYIDQEVPDLIDTYAREHSSEWGKTYTAADPISISDTLIYFNKSIVDTIDPTSEYLRTQVPSAYGVKDYVENNIPSFTPSEITDGCLKLYI